MAIRRAVTIYQSSVGKKVLMALTGLILFFFVIGHMVGNLKVFEGPEAFNGYARFLREMGYPLIPEYGVLWVGRILLLFAVGVHMAAAWQLWRKSKSARTHAYGKESSLALSYASHTMRWGGVLIALFVVYHLLHMTTGQAHPDFVYGDVYRNFTIAFSSPLVVGFYVVAQVALSFHIYHGVWSMTQTLGASHPRYDRWKRPIAGGFALALFVGFVIPPLAVLFGFIS